MKLRYLFLAAVLFAGACSRPSETFSTGIIPVPQHVNWGEGTFRMPRTLTYVTDLEGQEKSRSLQRGWSVRLQAGFSPFLLSKPSKAIFRLWRLRIADKGAPESYRLDVVRDSMTITAPDAARFVLRFAVAGAVGRAYGATYSRRYDRRRSRFAYRGFMLDVSRHFRDKEFVKRQLDLLARYKLNRFHWHLTDGAGWRIEIKKYPELTDFAAWRPLFLLYGVVLRRPALLSSG